MIARVASVYFRKYSWTFRDIPRTSYYPRYPIGQLFDSQVMNITDNQGVVPIFTIGSPKECLQKLTLGVFR